MSSHYPGLALPLPLLGGVVLPQRLTVPAAVVDRIADYRTACRLAFKLRRNRNLTKRDLCAQVPGMYPSHCTDYFSRLPDRRELPARLVAPVERVLGNTVISQWLARQAELTVLEELRAEHDLARSRAA